MSRRNHAGFLRPGYDPLKVPNAPTIGTATGGMNNLSVTFTAPSNVGGSAITGYYAVAKKTSDGPQTTVTGVASPITIPGLTAGSAYTVKVYAVNSYGPSAYSADSGSATPVAPPSVIGEAYGGGYYAGKITQGGVTYYVIVAPKASGQSGSTLQWKTANTAGPTATQTLNNGPAASVSMNSSTYPAAYYCEGLSIGGYTDWYLPSRDELELCYRNLKPGTTASYPGGRSKSSYTYSEGNDVSGDTMGINRNSSPNGSAYTSSVPAQTSATAFQTGNSEAFVEGGYWSSSEYDTTYAWSQVFGNGYQGDSNKNYSSTFYVRAVRRIPV